MFPDPNKHEHSRSLYVLCLDCYGWAINRPIPFINAAECGNCHSMNTVKYYPSCCMMEAYNQGKNESSN